MKSQKKTTWLVENQICMARGSAVALNRMFEDQNDRALFLHLWDRYLGNMTDVLKYNLSDTSWTVVFKTKKSLEIKRSYLKQRGKSHKAKLRCQYDEIGRILSEHFRIFLSQYVRRMNAKHGRKGTLVLERFQKYVFKTDVDYSKIFDWIITTDPVQKLVKYQAKVLKKGTDCTKNIFVNSPEQFLSNYLKDGNTELMSDKRAIDVNELFISVLRKFLKFSNNIKSPPPDS